MRGIRGVYFSKSVGTYTPVENWRITWDMIVAWAPESTKAFTSCPFTFRVISKTVCYYYMML